ncbi:MAG: TonB-dependent receptor [Flavobacterium sp.]|uniref:TonB-dependent receptor n=1 Tax=Flavobacterium sp. TaxID=239 RepID=UPI0022C4301C|nr:TonB-dependent receptor [Flavobacterium sp.]MCZ8330685.1 TonB-dependent receptor [Flavobacterium sp.]
MKKFNLLILLLFTSISFGQNKFTISGYVEDSKTGEKLFGVNVYTNSKSGNVTNEYGYFSFSLEEGKHTIYVSYIGFKTIEKEINVSSNSKVDFKLEEDSFNLNEVVISTTKIENKVKSTEMSVNTLKASTIKKLPAILGEPDVIKSIQLLPGVSSVNEASSGFNVRGGNADQNLILLDDATIYNASHLFGFFSVFNSDAIKDVKLYKGGIPSTYGGRLSSVLDVRQKEGNKKEFNGEAGIGLILSRVLVEGPIKKDSLGQGKGSYMFAGRRSYVDAFTFLDDEFKDNVLFFYDLNLKANYDINEKNKIFISGYFGRDRFELPKFIGTSWGNAIGTIRWTNAISEKLFFQTSAIFSNYDYELDNLRSGSEFRWKSNITNFNFKPKLTWYASSNATVRTGVDITHYKFNPGKISAINGSSITAEKFQNNFALENGMYIDAEFDLSEKINIQAGLRFSNFMRLGNESIRIYETGKPLSFDPVYGVYEENEVESEKKYGSGEVIKQFNNLEPRFSMRYLLNDRNSLKTSYNRIYQYIHLVTNTTSPTPLDVWTPSGPYIKPQFADQIALGYFSNVKESSYDFSVEAYYKKLTNVTDFKDGADLLFREDVETQVVQGVGRAYGLEFLLNKNTGKLTGWLSYTLSRSENKINGINNNEYYANNVDQLHRLNLVGLYKTNSRWEFGGVFTFSTGRPVTYPTGRYEQNGLVVADYSERNGNRLPVYHRLDISATLNPKKDSNKTGKWIFSIANLYNRQNAASIFFREISEVNDVEIATGNTEATKLSFFGIVPSVTYEFKF